MTRWNYQSDLILRESFYTRGITGELEKIAIPSTVDFRIQYHTRGIQRFTASRIGGIYENCSLLDEATLVVPIPLSQHYLGRGPLLRKLTIITPDSDFEKGTREICIPAETGFCLYDGPSDAERFNLASLAFYPRGSRTLGSLLNVDDSADRVYSEPIVLIKQKGAEHWTTTPLSEIAGASSSDLERYATQEWVKKQGFLTEHQSLADYATQQWVKSQGYLTTITLDSYATTTQLATKLNTARFDELFEKVNIGTEAAPVWAIRAKLGFFSDDFVSSKGPNSDGVGAGSATTLGGLVNVEDAADLKPLTDQILVRRAGSTHWSLTQLASIVGLDTEALADYLTANKYATQTWAEGRYLKAEALADYATESWVTGKGYITQDALVGYASTTQLAAKLDASRFDELFEKANIGTASAPVWAIRAKLGFFSDDFVSSKGPNSEGGGVIGATSLAALTDVTLTSPIIGDVLQYNGRTWVNTPMSAIKPDLTGYATQQWVKDQGFLTEHQSLANVLPYYALNGGLKAERSVTTWGIALGDTVAEWTDASGDCAFKLKKNAPDAGKISLVIDGTIYIDEGRNAVASQAWVSGQGYLQAAMTELQRAKYTYTSTTAGAADTTLDPNIIGYATGINGYRFFDTKFYNTVSATAHRTQVAYPYFGYTNISYRTFGNGAWGGWITLLDTNNYASVLDTYYAKLNAPNDFRHFGNEVTFSSSPGDNATLWLNYRLASGTGSIAEYELGDGTKGGYASLRAKSFVVYGGTAAQFLKADGSVDGTAYLPLTGGTIRNGTATGPLNIATDATTEVGIRFRVGSTDKGWIGYHPSYGTNLFNYAKGWYFGLKDDGGLYYSGGTIWHSGNDGADSGLDADMLDGVHNGYVTAQCARDPAYHDYNHRRTSANLNFGDTAGIHTFLATSSMTEGKPTLGDAHILHFDWDNGKSWMAQIAVSASGWMQVRGCNGDNTKWGAWKTVAYITDNVASASKLATARSLWGQAFDGTADVSGDMIGVAGGIALHRRNEINCFAGNLYLNHRGGGLAGFGTTGDIIALANGGKFGIGTTTPTCKLDVAGDIRTTGLLQVATSGSVAQLYIKGAVATTDYVHIYVTDSSSNTGRPLVLQNGYGGVAIGRASAAYKLHVSGVIFADSDADGYFRTEGRTGAAWDNGYGALSVGLYDNTAQTPLLLAYRYGGTWPATGANRLFAMEMLNSGTILRFSFGGAGKFWFQNDGTFHSVTGIYSDGYVSSKGQNTSSDAQLKTGLCPVALTMEQIAEAPAVVYSWRDGSGIDVGSIAQYWRDVLPEGVRRGRDGYLAMAYDKIALIASILTARRVVDHERRILELELESRELKRQLKQIAA